MIGGVGGVHREIGAQQHPFCQKPFEMTLEIVRGRLGEHLLALRVRGLGDVLVSYQQFHDIPAKCLQPSGRVSGALAG